MSAPGRLRVARGGIAMLLIALSLSACGTEPEPPPAWFPDNPRGVHAAADGPPDFLLVTIDTLRRDFVGAYGQPGDPTPVFDLVASEGVLFRDHYTVMAHTSPVHVTLFTGLPPLQHGVRKNGTRLDGDMPFLPQILQERGYRTGAAVGVSLLSSRMGFARGFDVFDEDVATDVGYGASPRKQYRRDARAVVDAALEFLAAGDGRPTFLWVHVYDPHAPWVERGRHFDATRELEEEFARRAEPSERYDEDDIVEHMREYAAEVRKTDAELERLLRAWDDSESGRAGLVVMTSDHGEGLAEHMLWGHGLWNYEEQLEVPLAIRMRGRIPAGIRVPSPSSHVDLFATCLDLLGLEAPRDAGTSLATRWRATLQPMDAPVFAERRLYRDADWARRDDLIEILDARAGLPGTGLGEQTAVIRDGWKYIWSEDSEDELYDLVADPREQRSVREARPELAAELLGVLKAWEERARSGAIQASAVEEQSDETEAMLEALGY